ncbi:MAG TPA: RsmB/NOP family class I SAM-dependent RNA methyltransferase [Candidatus Acidoferrales bacterium]|nr:RsmB/NOP family class I SAM-dependent RNA methyltransferase [Candidatus Acidoferrales bacterium]
MNLCQNLPEQMLDRWKKIYSEKEFNNLLEALSNNTLPSFRTNTIKTTTESLNKSLIKQGFDVERVSWYPDAFILKNKSIPELTGTDEYKNGLLYIQNLSSMIPVLTLDPQTNEKILDITAAPGSKATMIAAITKNKATIVANDISRPRLYKMERILNDYGIPFQKTQSNQIASISEFLTLRSSDSQGIPSFLITNIHGERIWQFYPEYFDKTLVDVPCSMEGRVRCGDPKTYQDWSPKKVKQLSKLQKYLLRSAISATRVGGIIVYSTCTLSPEENEEVIEWVVDKTPDALTVEKITMPNVQLQNSLTAWKKKNFKHTQNCARVFPSETMEGFFIAKIHKKASTISGIH